MFLWSAVLPVRWLVSKTWVRLVEDRICKSVHMLKNSSKLSSLAMSLISAQWGHLHLNRTLSLLDLGRTGELKGKLIITRFHSWILLTKYIYEYGVIWCISCLSKMQRLMNKMPNFFQAYREYWHNGRHWQQYCCQYEVWRSYEDLATTAWGNVYLTLWYLVSGKNLPCPRPVKIGSVL